MPAAATTRTQTPRPAAPTPQAAPAAAPRAAAPSPATRPLSGPPAIRLASPAGGAPDANLPEAVKAVINNPGSGELLLSPVRMSLENSLEVPLTPVRVHTDQRAGAAVDALGARAFTYGTHVFLGSRERPTDLALMAHEVTHVVQQHGKAVIQTSGGVAVSDRFEQEAQRTATAVQHGDQVSVRERTSGPRVQGVWPIDEAAQWIEDQAWNLLSQYAPELVPILRQGPVEWLKEKISAAVEAVFTTLMGPVRALTGIAGALIGHFANLLTWLRDAAARIARGDCAPLTEAAEKIQQVFEGLTAPVIDRIKQLVDRVKGFFSGLWERFGAPVWQFLQRIGGAAWERIQQLGRWIWDKTAPIRRALDRAWTWIKNKLGIGEGAEGQDGILQWLQRKAQAVWDQYLRPFYERFRTPILVTIGILTLLSPAGPLIAIAATWGTLAVGIRWIRQNLRNRTAIVQQRGLLEGRIIPGIMNAITRVSAFVLDKAQFISSKLTAVVTGLSQAVGAVAGTILGFAVGILQWIIARYQELVRWATGQLLALAAWVSGALERLRIFLMPVLNFLRRVAAVAANVMRLPYELGGRIWNAIPACLRDPFIDFFIPLILRQIPFFRNLAETPEVWQRTRAQVMGLFQQVFRDFDLLGAMRSAFRLIVQTLRIPVDLIAQLLDKAARAWDLVIAAPLRFIENALKAILFGLGNFMRNILSHLWFGVQGWLFNSLQGTGVTLPSSWTDLRAVFGFVLDVMGISIDHVIDLIDRRVPGAGAVLRRGVNFLTGAWEWLKVALTEGPRGIWRMLVDRLTGLGQIVLEAAVRWVMTRIVAIVGARLSALAASAGWSLVIEAVVFIYQAIRTAMEYAQRIFQIFLTAFNTVVQIAQGVVGPAATMIENGLRSILPIVIGFLANYAGLGGISNRIRDIIGGIRERVDAAILWLIDRGISTVQSLLNLIRSGVAAVVEWWKARKVFRQGNITHTLFFIGAEQSAQLYVESTRKTIRDYLNDDVKPKVPASHPTAANIALIEAEIEFIEGIKKRSGGGFGQAAGAEITVALNKIAELLVDIGDVVPETKVATRKQRTLADGSIVGEEMVAQPLTRNPGRYSGSAPYQETPTWKAVNRRVRKYIRGHLLNHHLYGAGNNENLVPITGSLNTTMSANVEEPLKEAVFGKSQILRYRVKVNFDGHPDPARRIPEELYLPSSITLEADEIEAEESGWKTKRSIYNNTLNNTLPSDKDPIDVVPKLKRLSINNPHGSPGDPDAKVALKKLPQVSDTRAELLLFHTGRFRKWSDVNDYLHYTDLFEHHWERHPNEVDSGRLAYLDGDTIWIYPP